MEGKYLLGELVFMEVSPRADQYSERVNRLFQRISNIQVLISKIAQLNIYLVTQKIE